MAATLKRAVGEGQFFHPSSERLGKVALEVTLTLQEMRHGSAVGIARHMRALGQRQSVPNMPNQHIIYSHILGAWGEIACARSIGREWDATIDNYKAADLGDNIQVRTYKRHSAPLIIRDEDDKSHVYFLVTCEAPPLFVVRGWFRVGPRTPLQDRWRDDPGGYGKPAWCVPQSALDTRGIGKGEEAA